MLSFKQKVFELTKRVPKGKVTTYAIIARKLGTSPRAVGQALKHNDKPIVVPCHRVVRSDGALGGYAGIENNKKKRLLLEREGVAVRNNKIVDFKKRLFKL